MKHQETADQAEPNLETMSPPPFMGKLETVLCHRCGDPFERSTERKHYYPPKICSVQPSPSTDVFVCAEKPWADPREEEQMKRRLSMHNLIRRLQSQKKGSIP